MPNKPGKQEQFDKFSLTMGSYEDLTIRLKCRAIRDNDIHSLANGVTAGSMIDTQKSIALKLIQQMLC
jgi:hypothetical protein